MIKHQKAKDLENKILDLWYTRKYEKKEIAKILKVDQDTVTKYTKNH